jgi:L-alanine-DL-glutamate epimerase-like enolase superfamily enzyme
LAAKSTKIMRIDVETFTVRKRFPLTISRGTTSQTTNIWVRIEQEGVEGWGEASPFSIASEERQSTEVLFEALNEVARMLETFSPWERQKIERALAEAEVPQQSVHQSIWHCTTGLASRYEYRYGVFGG